MAVDGADVIESQLLKQGPRCQETFDVLLDAVGELEQRRRDRQDLFSGTTSGVERAAGENACEVFVERTDWMRY